MSGRLKRVHKINISLQAFALTKAGTGLSIEVCSRGGRLGWMEVGRGGLIWRGRSKQKSKRLTWTRFAELMDAR